MGFIWLHGWSMNANVWQPLLTSSLTNYRHTMIDLPGHGGQPFVAGDLNQWGEVLAKQYPHAGIWVGWSLGGLLAIWMAQQFPQRVKKLILMASTPKFTADRHWQCGVKPVVFSNFERALQQNVDATLQRFIALQMLGAANAKKIVTFLRAQIEHNRPNRETLNTGLDILRYSDLRESLQQIHCPVLVLLGENDRLVAANTGDAIRGLCPRATIDIIPDAGHTPFLSHPGAVSQSIMRFILG